MSAKKNILGVDTSSQALSVALLNGARDAIFETNLEGTPRHSEELIDLIERGLKAVRLKKNEIDCFLWGLGPGSFTGLRIGLSVLKGFHLGFKKKSFGASSLDLIALGSNVTEGKLVVCVNARRERIYTSIYQFSKGEVKKTLSDSLLSFEEFMETVDSDTIFSGDALLTYGKEIREKLGKEPLFLTPSFWYPKALFLIKLYEQKRNWLKPLSLRTMRPVYLRRSEAEDRFALKRGVR